MIIGGCHLKLWIKYTSQYINPKFPISTSPTDTKQNKKMKNIELQSASSTFPTDNEFKFGRDQCVQADVNGIQAGLLQPGE